MKPSQSLVVLAIAGAGAGGCPGSSSPVVSDAATLKDQAALTDLAPVVDNTPIVDATPSCITITADKIADFTTDNSLYPADGRSGAFYVYGDGSTLGQFVPALVTGQTYPIDTTTGNPHCSGPGSFHTKATNWAVWGAALGTNFVPVANDAGGKGTYDASKYKGVSFWAMATTPLTGVQVSFPVEYTDAAADHTLNILSVQPCVYAPANPASNCSPFLVKLGDTTDSDFPAYQNMQINTVWSRFDIMFADTLQDRYNQGFHLPAPSDHIDTAHLTSMAIQVNAIYQGDKVLANNFEIWVDDVYFIE